MKTSETRPAISWIHLSDIHATDRRHWLQHEVLRGLPEAIEDCTKTYDISPDFLFVTGDLTDRGNAGGFRIAWDLVIRIAQDCGIQRDNIFVVPGNHDVDREKVSDLVDLIYQVPHESVKQKLTNYTERADLEHLRGYFRAVGLPSPKKGDPLSFGHSRMIKGLPVEILGLNSAWLSWKSVKEATRPGELISGSLQQFQQATTKLGTQRSGRRPPMTFVLTHYPPHWSNPNIERPVVGSAASGGPYFFLHGHDHTDWYSVEGSLWHNIAAAPSSMRMTLVLGKALHLTSEGLM
jgi:hypothetical protein